MTILNDLINSVVNEDLEKFKTLLTSDINLAEKFTDPDNESKQINLLNLILSYNDKAFFDAFKTYITKEMIDASAPKSSLFYSIKAAQDDTYFFDTLMTFNPDLTVKDEKGNNLLNAVSDSTLIPLDFVKKVMDNGANPFDNRAGSRENPYSSAAQLGRKDLVELFSTHPDFLEKITEEHLNSLIVHGLGDEFKRIMYDEKNSKLISLCENDYLFNQACQSENVIALDTLIDRCSFVPGKEQLSLLVKLMCQNYSNQKERDAAYNLGVYLFNINLPFDKFQDPDGKNAWALAIENNNKDIFQLLLDSPSTLNFVDDEQLSPLMYAIQEENLDFVKSIVAKKPYLMHKDINGNTALLKAIFRRSHDIVEYLTTLPNVGINEPNNSKQTPLNTAIQYKDIRLVNALIWSGALISLHPYKTFDDNSVMGFDSSNNFTILYDNQDHRTIDNFNALITMGFDPNQKNKDGDTLLNYFIKNGILQNFQSLVRCKMDVQVPDAQGNTPLFNAFEKEKDDYAISLLTFHHHLNFEHQNNDGETIYDIASYSNSSRRVAALVNADPDMTKEKLTKVLPILAMDANFYGLERVQEFIDYDFVDQNGNDLLMLSVMNNNINNFEFFQVYGGLKPDLKQKNALGKNLFDLIYELSEEDRAGFIFKLSSSNQEKYHNYEKKKITLRDEGDAINADGTFSFKTKTSPKI